MALTPQQLADRQLCFSLNQQKEQPTPIGPEMHSNVPFGEYLRWPLLSQSIIKAGRTSNGGSMKALKYAIENQGKEDPTDTMMVGSALHTAFLEPELAEERVILWSGKTRNGNEWEAFKKEYSDKIILTKGHYANLIGMVAALRADKEFCSWRARAKAVEVSVKGLIEGVPCKARTDALTDDPIWDLKSISSCDDRTVMSAIWTYGYHIQGFVYTSLFRRSRFMLGLVENAPPFDTRVVELSPAWLKYGKTETCSIIQRMKKCIETGRWPGHSEQIDMMEPPDWVAEEFGSASKLTMGGNPMF